MKNGKEENGRKSAGENKEEAGMKTKAYNMMFVH